MNINAIRMSTLILGIPLSRSELGKALSLLYEEHEPSTELKEFIGGTEKSLDDSGFAHGSYSGKKDTDNIFVMKLDDKPDGDIGLKVGTSCDTNEDHDEMRLAKMLGVKRGLSFIKLGVEIDMDVYEYHVNIDELIGCLDGAVRIAKSGEEVAEEAIYDPTKGRPNPVILSVYDDFVLTLDFDLFSGRILRNRDEEYGDEAVWSREGAKLILPRQVEADEGSVFILTLRAFQGAADNVEDAMGCFFEAYGMPLRGEKREKMISKANEICQSLMTLA